jgi:hypothetical protein
MEPGRRQGVPEKQHKYEQVEKTQTQTQKWEKIYISLCAAISSKNGGLNGSAFIDVFFLKRKKQNDKHVV